MERNTDVADVIMDILNTPLLRAPIMVDIAYGVGARNITSDTFPGGKSYFCDGHDKDNYDRK
jgi:hypothetical protein